MKTADYIEYIGTKPDGTVFESQATQMLLPPECDKYQTIKVIVHYIDGSEYTYMDKDE